MTPEGNARCGRTYTGEDVISLHRQMSRKHAEQIDGLIKAIAREYDAMRTALGLTDSVMRREVIRGEMNGVRLSLYQVMRVAYPWHISEEREDWNALEALVVKAIADARNEGN
ncbi:hypothetical protein ACFWY5_29770 [Nonomuraea sp. NPDC059007]|uniref:hypothetical protein n=1 Tax=Nonomuraea sp. NPDC059007 TaxID=3346692 RepID=UPI003696846D